MRVTFPLIPAAFTSTASAQVSGFEDIGLLTHCDCLICDSCSSGQCFAFDLLPAGAPEIPPRDGHPCRSANRSPCRVDSGLSPPSHPTATTRIGTAPVKALRAMPGAPRKSPPMGGLIQWCWSFISCGDDTYPEGQSYQRVYQCPICSWWVRVLLLLVLVVVLLPQDLSRKLG